MHSMTTRPDGAQALGRIRHMIVAANAIADSTWWLFENEYALPLIPAAAAAVLATLAEHVFSVALALGIATRASAAALLGMTAVIQIFVYPSAWVTHGLWAACFLALVAKGPGALSLDRLLRLDR